MLILHASKINETSSETVRVLGDVPTDNALAEIRYFREYLVTNKVALTGRGYFALTKRLLLTVRQAFEAQTRRTFLFLFKAHRNLGHV